MNKIKILIFSGNGINCEKETAAAFQSEDTQVDSIRLKQLEEKPELLKDYQILAFPGGFSYGDELGSGSVFSYRLKKRLFPEIKSFLKNKGLILGVCNGFQILTKLGVFSNNENFSLIHNKSGRFINKWTELKVEESHCVWTKNLPKNIHLPARHGEGRFIVENEETTELIKNSQVVFRYSDNFNGSYDSIAGITDETGQILGLMPHPEAALSPITNPYPETDIINKIFNNAIEYARSNKGNVNAN